MASVGDKIKDLSIRVKILEDFIFYVPEGFSSLIKKTKIIMKDYKFITHSLLQRKLSIGFVRALKLMEKLEEKGFISKANGSKPRKVIKK